MTAASAAEVSVRQVQQHDYEFVLTNSTPLSESEAQQVIASVAANVCKDLRPVLGKYRFEAKEAIGDHPPSSPPSTYEFTQEVSCIPAAKTAQAPRLPTLLTPQDSQRVQEDIRLKSEAYFRLIADQRIDDAYAQLSAGMMGVDEATWKTNAASFQAMAGKPLQISIVKITVYDNPADAPQPGLYVAADYSNVFENVPIHCGYLMWFRPIGGSFLITREEKGFVSTEQLKLIPSAQLPEIKRKFRCLDR